MRCSLKILQGFTLISLFITFGVLAQEVYVEKDKEGNISVSDQPSENTKAYQVNEPNIAVLPEVPVLLETESKDEGVVAVETPVESKEYTNVEIISPEDGTQVRGVELPASMLIRVAVEPGLQDGHMLQLYVNGNKSDHATTHLGTELYDLYRGNYKIKFDIVDENNKTLVSSNTVEFNIFQPGQ